MYREKRDKGRLTSSTDNGGTVVGKSMSALYRISIQETILKTYNGSSLFFMV